MKNIKFILSCLIISMVLHFELFGQSVRTSNAGHDKTICIGQSVQLGYKGSPGKSYNWTPSAGLDYDNSAQPIASPLVTTTYFLNETDLYTGEHFFDTVMVVVNPLPEAKTGQDKEVCFGSGVKIGDVAKKGSTYLWLPCEGLTSVTESRTMAYPNSTTKYFLTETITSTGCIKTNTVTIKVNPNPEAIVGPDRFIFPGEKVPVGVNPVNGYTYVWTTPDTPGILTDSRPVVSPKVSTTYHLTVTNSLTGCQNTNFVTVVVNPPPAKFTNEDITGYEKTINGTLKIKDSFQVNPIQSDANLKDCENQVQQISKAEHTADFIQIFPNPNPGIFKIQNTGMILNPFSIQVCNSVGEVVYQQYDIQPSQNEQLTIRLKNIEQGVYYLKLKSNDIDKVIRFIVKNQ